MYYSTEPFVNSDTFVHLFNLCIYILQHKQPVSFFFFFLPWQRVTIGTSSRRLNLFSKNIKKYTNILKVGKKRMIQTHKQTTIYIYCIHLWTNSGVFSFVDLRLILIFFCISFSLYWYHWLGSFILLFVIYNFGHRWPPYEYYLSKCFKVADIKIKSSVLKHQSS